MDLLYIEGKTSIDLTKEGEVKQHYVYIKDFNRFMSNFTKYKVKKHFCRNCLQCLCSEESLELIALKLMVHKLLKCQNLILTKME